MKRLSFSIIMILTCVFCSAQEVNVDSLMSKADDCFFVTGDFKTAISCYREAADAGDAVAMMMMGRCYEEGLGTSYSEKKAIEYYKAASDAGNADASSKLGDLYYYNNADFKNAVKWYSFAAGQGSLEAAFSLGKMFSIGLGTEQNQLKALNYWIFAADGGHKEALEMVGQYYYMNGKYENAVSYFEKAAEKGMAKSQFYLAACQERGLGTERDFVSAAYWYMCAADKGIPEAQLNLGNMYFLGYGVKKNPRLAASWYEEAANRNNPQAQYNIGCCYLEGVGVAKDFRKAKMYLKAAKENGIEGADAALKKLKEQK